MLTREQILAIDDIKTKKITVPVWNTEIYIKQLTRGEQDQYLKRQYGDTRLSQTKGAENQVIDTVNLYGHDSYLCSCGICDETGKRIFSKSDMEELAGKNGEAIGFIASEIVKFSGMGADVEIIDELKN